MAKRIEIKDFAERVERVCDFFIAKVSEETGRRESNDLRVIEDLKEDAANLQFDPATETLTGLHDYMNGLNPIPEEQASLRS